MMAIRKRNRFFGILGLLVCGSFLASGIYLYWTLKSDVVIERSDVRRSLARASLTNALPSSVKVIQEEQQREYDLIPEYTLDRAFQESMRELLQNYSPDYGSFVAMDPRTGKILSLLSVQKASIAIPSHLALRATFPSASIFKVVTAAAAIATKKANPDTMIPYNGRPHTLYRSHVLKANENRWTQKVSLREAFARSINTVFGKLGVFFVGSDRLREYADRFGFDQEFASDLPVEMGKAYVSNDSWELAEASSGFTNQNTMSPLHGAVIAATVVNDGERMVPYLISELKNYKGESVYQAKPEMVTQVFDRTTALELRELMRATIDTGTSKNSFRGFKKGVLAHVDVGGKTGSLTGYNPFGKYEWFVGYGDDGTHSIALAAMVVSRDKWKVKASYVARRALEIYFKKREVAQKPTKQKKTRG